MTAAFSPTDNLPDTDSGRLGTHSRPGLTPVRLTGFHWGTVPLTTLSQLSPRPRPPHGDRQLHSGTHGDPCTPVSGGENHIGILHMLLRLCYRAIYVFRCHADVKQLLTRASCAGYYTKDTPLFFFCCWLYTIGHKKKVEK